jgi:transcriptional regulator with XRE-family HTH domain
MSWIGVSIERPILNGFEEIQRADFLGPGDRPGARKGMDALPSSRGGACLTLVAMKPRSYAYPNELTTIGDHIRKRRLDLGLEQKIIGQRMGVCCLTISGWEKGHTEPKVRHLPDIIAFLGYDPRPEPNGLPERLVWYREGKGWSQERMAEFLGVDEATISGW